MRWNRKTRLRISRDREVIFDLDSLLDEHSASPPSKQRQLEPEIFQAIIRTRKLLKKMEPEDPERVRIEKRISGYSNALVQKR